MSMQSLERVILAEAKEVTGIKKLRMKDIMKWSTGEVKPEDGEQIFRLPRMGVNIAIKK